MTSKYDLHVVKWGEFSIGTVFEIKKVKGLPLEKYKNGQIPYLSTSAENNALVGFIEADEKIINKKNALSVDPIKGKVFYHGYDFVGRGFSGASINLLYHPNINRYSGCFIIKSIEQTSFRKASYANLFNSNRLKQGRILLPKDKAGNPDWDFMEGYMREKERKQLETALSYYKSNLGSKTVPKMSLENCEWRAFEIGYICDIFPGIRLTKTSMNSGNKPFIGATDANNGITNFVSNSNGSEDSNVLGVNYNGSVVENFYHPYSCIFSDDVKRFKLKNEEGNQYKYLFLKKLILNQKSKYQYAYKFNENRMKKQKILLPINLKGEPDWKFMEHYMHCQEQKQIKKYMDFVQKKLTIS